MNADVDMPALDVDIIELRQLLEAIELELDATWRPLRVLVGETPRFSTLLDQRSILTEDEDAGPHVAELPSLRTGG